ncbi:MAG: single-stranded DNA-binding protein [Verrucomicrobiales bacterium]|nr:single-stranded DNA-binding protein [Verrucomicrobiales bacterium]
MDNSEALITAAAELRDAVDALRFESPVACVYDPLRYAWAVHEAYLRRYGKGRKRVVFLGMNPGPFGMAQTGVPFGEVAVVRDWLGLGGAVGRPDPEHPKRPVTGFACERSEVSGRRLWGLFAETFGTSDVFFADHFVANYCPLVFMNASGGNVTPDKLPAAEAGRLFEACDRHLRAMVAALRPAWLVGVGAFAEKRAAEALAGTRTQVRRILHPSPASPAANKGWSSVARGELVAAGIWR